MKAVNMRILQIFEDVQMAFSAIFANKLRSILTTLGIIIGVMAVIAIVSIINGMNQLFINELLDMGSDVFVLQKDDPIITSREQFLEMQKRPDITLEDYKGLLDACPSVSYISPTARTFKRAKHEELTSSPMMVWGTDAYQQYMKSMDMEMGRFLSPADNMHGRLVCVLGYDIYKELFPNENPVGKTVKLGAWKMKVIGVAEQQGTFFGQSRDIFVAIPVKTFLKIYGFRRSVELSIKAKEGRLEQAKDEITSYFRRVRHLSFDQSNNFTIATEEGLVGIYQKTTAVAYLVMIGVATISLIVGGIGIMNIMFVSVKERTREIGTRKALGARRSNILWQFLVEAVMLCLIGGAIGLGLGVIIAMVVRATTPLPAAVPLWTYIVGVVIPCVIGVVFGVVPAYKASRLDPIEALRYE